MSRLYKYFCKSYKLDRNNDSDFFGYIEKLYDSDEVQSLEQYEQHLEINRLQHITSVTYLSYIICRHFGFDTSSATRAAIMHDLFYYDWRDGKNGKWHHLHGYKHPKYAVKNAAELCPDITEKELEIIRTHMWPLTVALPSSKEGFVVSLCDKYCASLELLYSKSESFKKKFLSEIK